MELTQIEARDLSEAWYLCIRECMDKGHIYTIDRGSHPGQQRKEFDSITDASTKYGGEGLAEYKLSASQKEKALKLIIKLHFIL